MLNCGLRLAGLVLCLSGPPLSAQRAGPPPGHRDIAITFDDLPGMSVTTDDIRHFERLTTALLSALGQHRVTATGFVIEGQLEERGRKAPRRVAILRQWLQGGHDLGNHTFSHLDLHKSTLGQMETDVLRGEQAIRPLLREAGRVPRYFRHPYLRTGRDLATRETFERFLATHGYRVAPVTINTEDWVFAAAFDRAVATGDNSTADRIVRAYLEHTERIVHFSEQLAMALFSRAISQVLLLHANALNARSFDGLARQLTTRGYSFITLERALLDSAYSAPDTYTDAVGRSWIHHWAVSARKYDALLAGEPQVPAWILTAAKARR